jgi:phosphoenolpyruvate---glycerone phosphotransferase subunit DhaK
MSILIQRRIGMKKIINRPEDFVKDTMEGIIAAYGDKVKLYNDDYRILLSSYPVKEGKVGIVTAGGSGHLPVFLGYVGQGLLDGCTVGNVFASPSSAKMADTIRACDRGNGVLVLFGNYGGDKMNFELACETVDLEDDIKTEMVLVKDDVASAPASEAERRRGVAGMIYAFKIAGAKAENGGTLKEVADVTRKALKNIRTMGMALTSCIVPEVGKPTFSLADDEMEIGMGIHGEPGLEVRKMMTAAELADLLLSKILSDMPLVNGDEVSIMINGLGATPLEEQLIVYKSVAELLQKRGVRVYMPHIGEYATSMEMAGISITLFKLDAELKGLLGQVARSPFYTNYNK